ncbi:peptide-N(4)-(N-acetyl-beta-glucosaminyl)asparagine amidase isoform X2 [Pectinophora gossypiella]|uniref:peptide-N(4)-(N-acetyl-beta- glucosaminyl)asparagine amidase isoform X2 n=1 Tax=Pectinophora gossypiella TaxID=13191 RepID=UPI00214EEED1|nr:peptide-N(4)-(N-acetyl-beta-glucosaminyl)asparagine amidase isoform X2 [Pectinophora gossypiella]
MEDMARLALVEQNVRDMETFSKILYELLRYINHILDNPHDYELRTIRNEDLKKFLRYEAFVDYLKSIGFQSIENELTYPKEHTLSNLRMAQAAIERKIYFCYGVVDRTESMVKSLTKLQAKQIKLTPARLLNTNNPILLKLEALFNDVLQYESLELQALAREQLPLVTLQLMALDEMREHQRKIKTGEIKGHDMPFDIALLKVLLSWFKHRFFSWVDAPDCDACGAHTAHVRNSTITTDSETCRVEIYKCSECGSSVEFPRYNNVRTLLRTRRGRCGEWANCFALFCRALGYDTRMVLSTTDHVWCEIWDYDSNTWLHADPCECLLDAPLTYEIGWGKKLTYVLACSRDDVQDVTWRYTTHHKEVVKRRQQIGEEELMSAILSLRAHRQRQVSEPRRRYLAKRCLEELAQFLTERKPGSWEVHGRISGSAAWRTQRGEMRARGHVFTFSSPGDKRITYCAVTDRYEVEGGDEKEIVGWAAGAYSAQHMFRMVEKDWKMVYLAREEGSELGVISWVVEAGGGCCCSRLAVRAAAACWHDAHVSWTLQLDQDQPAPVDFSESWTEVCGRFVRAVITARLRGGRGGAAWQHAQLFRAPLAAPRAALHLALTVRRD